MLEYPTVFQLPKCHLKTFPISWCTINGIHKTIGFTQHYKFLNSCFDVFTQHLYSHIIWSNLFHSNIDLFFPLKYLHYWICKENEKRQSSKNQQFFIEILHWGRWYISFYFKTKFTIWRRMLVCHPFTLFKSKYWN